MMSIGNVGEFLIPTYKIHQHQQCGLGHLLAIALAHFVLKLYEPS